MNSIAKSDAALDKLFSPAYKLELDKIFAEVEAMKCGGPKAEEYFESIESHFQNSFDLTPAFVTCDVITEDITHIPQYAIECKDFTENYRRVESTVVKPQPIKKTPAPEKIFGGFSLHLHHD